VGDNVRQQRDIFCFLMACWYI